MNTYHEPVPRKVTPTLTVRFRNSEYDVRSISGIQVGEILKVTDNPNKQSCVCVAGVDSKGNAFLYDAPQVTFNSAGFRVDACLISKNVPAIKRSLK